MREKSCCSGSFTGSPGEINLGSAGSSCACRATLSCLVAVSIKYQVIGIYKSNGAPCFPAPWLVMMILVLILLS